jgi:hypothetical protein
MWNFLFIDVDKHVAEEKAKSLPRKLESSKPNYRPFLVPMVPPATVKLP